MLSIPNAEHNVEIIIKGSQQEIQDSEVSTILQLFSFISSTFSVSYHFYISLHEKEVISLYFLIIIDTTDFLSLIKDSEISSINPQNYLQKVHYL